MPSDHVTVLMGGAAILLAIAIGAASSTFKSAARDAFGVWLVLVVLGLFIPYIDFSIAGAIGAGIAFCVWAVLAQAARRVFRRRAA